MDNNKKDGRNKFFSRSISPAFKAVSLTEDDTNYAPPVIRGIEQMPAFLREQLDGTQRKDPWGQGWHNGFPPPAIA